MRVRMSYRPARRSRSSGRALRFYLGGLTDVALQLHELLAGARRRARRRPVPRRREQPPVPGGDQRAAGGLQRRPFDAARDAARPSGMRLLQEYFAFAQRFLFFDVAWLAPRLRRPAAAARARLPVRSPRARARRLSRARELPAALRSGDQPVRAARRTAELNETSNAFHLVPSDGAGRLRGVRHPERACLRRGQRRAGVRSAVRRPVDGAGSRGRLLLRCARAAAAAEPSRRGGAALRLCRHREVFVSLVDPRDAPYRAHAAPAGGARALHQSRPAPVHAARAWRAASSR